MPELPDVEVARRRVARKVLHRLIAAVRTPDERLLKGIGAASLRRRLKGKELLSTRRHGKHVFLELGGRGKEGDAGWLALHFGMTGYLQVLGPEGPPPPHIKLQLDFEDGGRLTFSDPRTFGAIAFTEDVGGFIEEHDLGPDALSRHVDLPAFHDRLKERSSRIKSTLMDQSVLAGLGNVYTDEVLFQAELHPTSRTDRLTESSIRSLHRSLRRVLEQAIRRGADPEAMPPSFLLPHRHPGGRCPRCGTKLRQDKIDGRTTYHCPQEQPRNP